MPDTLKSHLTNGETWWRGLLIVLFAVIYGVAEIVLTAVVVLQFGSHLFTGASNVRLLDFARALNAYIYQILQFVTYRSEARPFPLSPWPASGLDDVAAQQREEAANETAMATSRSDEEPREY